jgi:hypothetical protein
MARFSREQIPARTRCTRTALEVSIDNFGKTVKCDFVIVVGGKEIQVIETDRNTVVVGNLKNQLDSTAITVPARRFGMP